MFASPRRSAVILFLGVLLAGAAVARAKKDKSSENAAGPVAVARPLAGEDVVLAAGLTVVLDRTEAVGELLTLLQVKNPASAAIATITTHGGRRGPAIAVPGATPTTEILVPAGRSYDGSAWEAVDPLLLDFACTDTACNVTLPAEGADAYILRARSARVHDKDSDAWRLLSQGSFGPTRETIADAVDLKTATRWVEDQMYAVKATSHRAHFRQRATPRLRQASKTVGVTEPCEVGSRWRRFALDADDIGHELSFKARDDDPSIIELYVEGRLRTLVDGSAGPLVVDEDNGVAWNLCFVDESVGGLIQLGVGCNSRYFVSESSVGLHLVNPPFEFFGETPPTAVATVVLEDLTPQIPGSKIARGFDSCPDFGGRGPARLGRDAATGEYYAFDRRMKFFDASLASAEAEAEADDEYAPTYAPTASPALGAYSRTGRRTCETAPKTFLNAASCVRKPECSAPRYASTPLLLDGAALRDFYDLEGLYVYRVEGLQLTSYVKAPCDSSQSRWVLRSTEACATDAPAFGSSVTQAAFEAALTANLTTFGTTTTHVIDLAFDDVFDDDSEADCVGEEKGTMVTVRLAGVGGRGGGSSSGGPPPVSCWQHAHSDEFSVYDFSYWTIVHPGNPGAFDDYRKNPIAAFGEALVEDRTTFVPTLTYPGWHPANRWESTRSSLPRLGAFGDVVDFATLPDEALGPRVAAKLGAARVGWADAGFEFCGSPDEVATDASLGYTYHAYDTADKYRSTTDFDVYHDDAVRNLWLRVALGAPDQLRQRVAWVLAQIFVVQDDGPNEESLHAYYDIFVRHGLGLFRDVVKEVAYSPLMGRMLTYEDSKSLQYSAEKYGRASNPDENFARELMQLFTIGLVVLDDDGTTAGTPTYAQENVVEFARVWTGFENQENRGNVQARSSIDSLNNYIDPMRITDGRDVFPKLGLASADEKGDPAHLGAGLPRCADLGEYAWLKKGATWRYLGTRGAPDLLSDDGSSSWATAKSRLDNPQLVLHAATSELYKALCDRGGSSSECRFRSEVVLDRDLACDGHCLPRDLGARHGAMRCECTVTREPRIVRIDPSAETGSPLQPLFYEYVRPPCVHLAFPREARAVVKSGWPRGSAMCADAQEVEAGVACCDDDDDGDERYPRTLCVYQGERVDFLTAEQRCAAVGRSVCKRAAASTNRYCGADAKTWYQWTQSECAVLAKVESSTGRVAVVHDVSATGKDVEARVAPETLTFFGVLWDDRGWPTVADGCKAGRSACTVYSNTTCLCATETKKTTKKGRSTVDVGDRFAFENPPVFHSFVEYARRDSHYETEALLDHLVDHPNTAPFIAKSFIRRLTTSNPSPRYVAAATEAFRTGSYESLTGKKKVTTFGTGVYGDLAALTAAVILDPEARSGTLDADPTFGSFKEPILKVTQLMRALEYGTAAAAAAAAAAARENNNGRALVEFSLTDDLDYYLGQDPHFAPSVFSFFLPDYSPAGPIGDAGLVSPETMVLAGPKLLGYLNGVLSLVRYGLSDCDRGLGQSRERSLIKTGKPEGQAFYEYVDCDEAAEVSNPSVRVSRRFTPACWGGATNVDGCSPEEVVDELDDLLLNGRLTGPNRALIVEAYAEAHRFTLHDENSMTWAEADAECVARGGHLALPCSFAENAELFAIARTASSYYVWLGTTDTETEGVWSLCPETGYSAWYPGEPNDWGDAGEDCGCMRRDYPFWNDIPCDRRYHFICASDDVAALEVALQLIAISPEFQMTNDLDLVTDDRGEPLVRPNTTLDKSPTDDAGIAEHKAILYVFLGGGADSFSTLVPHSDCPNGLADQYYEVRTNVAPSWASLHPVAVDAVDGQPCGTFGIHGGFENAHGLFEAGELSFVANIGVLVDPIADRAAYDGGAERPPSLFSHSSQTDETQTVHAQNMDADGVLGRVGDAMKLRDAGLSFDAYSLAGSAARVLEGAPGLRGSGGVLAGNGVQNLVGAAVRLKAPLKALTQYFARSLFGETYSGLTHGELDRADYLDSVLDDIDLVNGDACFSGGLADQFETAARLINIKDQLGADRQVFYLSQGGYDTHGTADHTSRFAELDRAIACFRAEMIAQGRWDDITIVTASEFGRTLTSNGIGTDHAWGGVHFITGGAVNGGHILGKYPDDISDTSHLTLGEGRLIPTTPWEALWNGVAKWFGVHEDDMNAVLPNLANFPKNTIFEEEDLYK